MVKINWKVSLEDIFYPNSDKVALYEVESSQDETEKAQKYQFIITREITKYKKENIMLEHLGFLNGPNKGDQDILLYKTTNQGIERSLAVPIGPIGNKLPDKSLDYVYNSKSVLLLPKTINKNQIWWDRLEENPDLGTIEGQNKYEIIGLENLKINSENYEDVLHIKVTFTPDDKNLEPSFEDYYIKQKLGIIKHVISFQKKEQSKMELIKFISKKEAENKINELKKLK